MTAIGRPLRGAQPAADQLVLQPLAEEVRGAHVRGHVARDGDDPVGGRDRDRAAQAAAEDPGSRTAARPRAIAHARVARLRVPRTAMRGVLGTIAGMDQVDAVVIGAGVVGLALSVAMSVGVTAKKGDPSLVK